MAESDIILDIGYNIYQYPISASKFSIVHQFPIRERVPMIMSLSMSISTSVSMSMFMFLQHEHKHGH
jgi:hypothetical protein